MRAVARLTPSVRGFIDLASTSVIALQSGIHATSPSETPHVSHAAFACRLLRSRNYRRATRRSETHEALTAANGLRVRVPACAGMMSAIWRIQPSSRHLSEAIASHGRRDPCQLRPDAPAPPSNPTHTTLEIRAGGPYVFSGRGAFPPPCSAHPGGGPIPPTRLLPIFPGRPLTGPQSSGTYVNVINIHIREGEVR